MEPTVVDLMEDIRLREVALHSAVQISMGRAGSGQDVVGIAEGFLAFLKGGATKEPKA